MIKVTETKPGHIALTCKTSGKPLTRTSQFGMFCSDPDCKCERDSMTHFGDLALLVRMFGN